ncbi:ANAPC13 [Cervus elaphus hippelaphus]|uniref:Anaphase-promoting complex subunit 13 n=1 Tax=Cervus elaphus hippelaphus TaxID=46360 RepID=A0A212CJE7_CEREH|nr:ANAPC13 [Cervus elaphus hippelaphus]
MRLQACHERAPESSRRYLRTGARTRVTANLTSSHGPIRQDQSSKRMDSEVQRDGRILDLIDDAWREDKLPYEDVAIPLNELPEPEQDNGGTTESVKEQEMKWTDLALQYLHENVPPVGN